MTTVFKSILCPVDFSEHSERALRIALELAALAGADLTIMTAIDPFLEAASAAAGHGDTFLRQTHEEVQQLLTRISGAQARLRKAATISAVKGDAGEAIIKHIDDCHADLVVMGTQGLGAAKRMMFGSTTNHVLRESRVPVLAVPPPAQ
jgi:nucleotide-binding universal stress UspA family protein